ncbi:hypothetical protein LINPERPRIM_LOCUS36021 [Linum perenne]
MTYLRQRRLLKSNHGGRNSDPPPPHSSKRRDTIGNVCFPIAYTARVFFVAAAIEAALLELRPAGCGGRLATVEWIHGFMVITHHHHHHLLSTTSEGTMMTQEEPEAERFLQSINAVLDNHTVPGQVRPVQLIKLVRFNQVRPIQLIKLVRFNQVKHSAVSLTSSISGKDNDSVHGWLKEILNNRTGWFDRFNCDHIKPVRYN